MSHKPEELIWVNLKLQTKSRDCHSFSKRLSTFLTSFSPFPHSPVLYNSASFRNADPDLQMDGIQSKPQEKSNASQYPLSAAFPINFAPREPPSALSFCDFVVSFEFRNA
jgi:hypothetical protein